MIVHKKHEASLPDVEMVKLAVDIDRHVLAFGCEFHIDCAEELVEDGSMGEHIWGANIYPKTKEIDFVSLINIRPHADNRSMDIQKLELRTQVKKIIEELLL
jgi:hypothetical protein